MGNRINKNHFQKGFTLLEALIAVLVLSFGLLGVAAMQLKAMQSSHLSYHRSIATLAAQDAVERLWIELGSASNFCPDPDAVKADWLNHWASKLPNMNASASSDIESPSACEYKVIVSWEDNRFSDNADVSSLSYFTRLPGREAP
ncbi:type IV pilus modification protein PilV [Halomonas sp. H5]|uniref:type IV pilus modification protein PilV n=1 Tax=Halomonas sp. H5 TaxID=3423910 RepID=UPI003D35E1F5